MAYEKAGKKIGLMRNTGKISWYGMFGPNFAHKAPQLKRNQIFNKPNTSPLVFQFFLCVKKLGVFLRRKFKQKA
jgi:hypothetical protein